MKRILALLALCVLNHQLHAQVSFTLSSSPVVGNGPWSVTAADVNGDGKVDSICVNWGDQTLSVLTNKGSGGFVLASSPGVGGGPESVAAADVNGDGRVDLISANTYDDTLSVLTNNGSGTFVLASSPGVDNYPRCVVAADVNGDGRVDLISANWYGNSLSVLTNAGAGRFFTAGTYAVGSSPISVTAADVNADGKVDLISANRDGNSLSVLTNNGSGGFVSAGTYAVGTTPCSVVVADVNVDGWSDLICANYYDNTLSVLTNNGSGGFVIAGTYAVGTSPFSIVTADVNGDGRMDLISANVDGNTLSVLTNNGIGSFGLALSPVVGDGPRSVTAADVNGDGKIDLISANYSSAALSVLTNRTAFPPSSLPLITSQPAGQTIGVGASATFNVSAVATGTERARQFGYQWRLAGTNLPMATNNVLTLTNLSLSQAGNYDVVVSNYVGSVTSSPAILDVRFILVRVNGQLVGETATAVSSAAITISGGYPNGFIFYTLDGSTPTTGSTLYDGQFMLTNSVVLRAMSLSADFSQSSEAPPVTVQIIPVYTLQTSVIGSGTLSANPANGPYISNSVVMLTATAAQYWAFDHWTGDATGNSNPVTVTMNGPRSVQAVFVRTAYPLTVSTPGGGSVTADGQAIAPATYYPAGSVVTIAATASNGWSFLGWQGDASGTNNPLSVTMNQTNNIQAIFGTVVGTNTAGGGHIVLNQPNPVPFGTTLSASAVPDSGKYLVTWSGAASGTNSPTTIMVTSANPTVGALFTTLPGGKYSLAVVVMGDGAVTISPQQNYYSPGDNVMLTAATTAAGTRFSGWTGDASGTNSSLLVTMNSSKTIQANFGASPTVSISPLNLIVFGGSNAVLNANASGLPPLTYQWQDNQGVIAGATNASYTILGAQATNSGNYAVIVSNPFGSATSAVATVIVVFPPSISLQPLSNTVAAGTSLTLAALADGTAPLAYRWKNDAGAIPGQTNSSLILSPAQTNQTGNYSVIVSNTYGAVTSHVAGVFVYLPVSILAQPVSLVVPASAPASFGVAAYGFPAPTYQWTHNGTNLVGATSSALNISQVHLTDLGYYQALVSNGYSSTNSAIATLNMSPTLISPFIGATTIWGRSAVLSVGAIGSGELSYQWYKDGQAIDGATGETLNFTSIQFTNGGLYSVVVSSAFGSVTNVAAQVIVNPAGVALGFSPTLSITGVVGYSYIIQRSADLTDTNAWVTLTNLTLTQPVQLWVDTNVDVFTALSTKHFYRVLPGQ